MTVEHDPSEPEAPDPGSLERMWQHGLHLDTMLFQRANLFLVVESLLVVAYALVLGVATQPGNTGADMALMAARTMAAFGLLVTLVWGYVGHRHLRYFRLVQVRAEEALPEYKQLRDVWKTKTVSALSLVTYFLPLLAEALWVLLLLITLR
ncbi:hypothetical protein AB0M50_34760 [Nonomuraea fuscirosea]|uniref:hypothetical protein n=1 Tax=Nonomuraea fuscirosea TaxID=1291556 RepID=UPI0034236F1A